MLPHIISRETLSSPHQKSALKARTNFQNVPAQHSQQFEENCRKVQNIERIYLKHKPPRGHSKKQSGNIINTYFPHEIPMNLLNLKQNDSTNKLNQIKSQERLEILFPNNNNNESTEFKLGINQRPRNPSDTFREIPYKPPLKSRQNTDLIKERNWNIEQMLNTSQEILKHTENIKNLLMRNVSPRGSTSNGKTQAQTQNNMIRIRKQKSNLNQIYLGETINTTEIKINKTIQNSIPLQMPGNLNNNSSNEQQRILPKTASNIRFKSTSVTRRVQNLPSDQSQKNLEMTKNLNSTSREAFQKRYFRNHELHKNETNVMPSPSKICIKKHVKLETLYNVKKRNVTPEKILENKLETVENPKNLMHISCIFI